MDAIELTFCTVHLYTCTPCSDMSEGEELTPTVLWAQRQKMIILTIKYQPAEVCMRTSQHEAS